MVDGYDVNMSPLILIAVIGLLPLILFVVLRVKPLYLFVSIVSGYFNVEFLGATVQLMLGSVIKVNNVTVFINVALLLLPLVITLFLMRKTLSTSSLPFQFILLVANSLLVAAFLVPLLTPGVQGTFYLTQPGSVLRQSNDVLIPAIAGMHVLVMWIMRPRHDDHAKHKGH